MEPWEGSQAARGRAQRRVNSTSNAAAELRPVPAHHRGIERRRVQELLSRMRQCRVTVVGDVMLDEFVWGNVTRISPEAPVPVVECERISVHPGGAANVARNLAALRVQTRLVGLVGDDEASRQLRSVLSAEGVACDGLVAEEGRCTTVKTRVIAHRQQVLRVDREQRTEAKPVCLEVLQRTVENALRDADAVILADYGKGVLSDRLVRRIRDRCQQRGTWLSLDPKPGRTIDYRGMSLMTPNRKEAFELARTQDRPGSADPAGDTALHEVVATLQERLSPAVLLVTLGEWGMLLCTRGEPRVHIPTVARQVFDVCGAGDTVIGAFTGAIAAGASPQEAAHLANHAAGIVVGKVGTAIVTPSELRDAIRR